MTGKQSALVQRKTSTHSTSSRPSGKESLAQTSRHVLGIQPAIKVGKTGDVCEKQADQVADRVVSGEQNITAGLSLATPQLAAKPQPQLEPVNREGLDEGEEKSVQARQKAFEPTSAVEEGNEENVQAKAVHVEESPALSVEEDLQAKPEEEALQAKADSVEEVPEPLEEDTVQAKSAEKVSTEASDEPEKPEELQAKPNSGTSRDAVVAPGAAFSRTGSPLNESVRGKMERAFNADFSGVRIHTDDAAVVLNQHMGARALTRGDHIYFNEQEFSPESRQGEHLLAHELTHTLQQKATKNASQSAQRKEQAETYKIRPELLAAVNFARGKIGQVNAKQTDEAGNRVGWTLLQEFFNTAFGGQHPLNASVIQKPVMLTGPDGKKKDALPSWCGIFVWWSLKSAGIPIPDWKLGQSVMGFLKARPKGETPRKGDIAYREAFQHFAIVSGVKSENGQLLIATINGNTAGADNLGGQIQEQWHSPAKWLGFFDPTAKLNLPETALVTTTQGPDALQEQTGEQTTQTTPVQPETAQPEPKNAESAPAASEPATAESPTTEDVTLELPDIPPAPPMEPVAKIESLDLKGSSDNAVSTVATARPSQVALEGHKLGGAVSGKLKSEQQQEVKDAPQMQVNLAGKVSEGITPADQLMPASADITEGKKTNDPKDLSLDPHQNHGAAPSNAANEKELEKQSKGGSFLDWLKANIKRFMNAIKTSDPNLNTSAGPQKKVPLQGGSDPSRMAEQRQDAGNKLRGKRDDLTGKLKTHPGQANIQAKSVQQSKPVALKQEEPAAVETAQANEAQDYADAELPQAVRDKADEQLEKGMAKNLAKADQDARQAAEKKDTDKNSAISDAEAKTKRLNEQADADQKKLVIDNRQSVATKQKEGIEKAYGSVNTFEQDAGKRQADNNTAIKDKVKNSEDKADVELKKGEKDAEAKKREGEKEAREKKEKLEREQKNQSWWDRAKNAIKSAVKAITAAIDKVFTAIRSAVKSIIDKAKKLAIDAINAARNFVVDKLNKFRDWAKDKVNKYLGEHFPGIASAINGAIDGVVDVAIAGVNMVADGAIAAVEAVANALAAALDKILSVFQAVLKAAVQIVGAVLTGDFLEALKIAIRTGCEIAGIDPKPIFDFFDRAAKKLVSILKSPGKFFNNLVKAVGMGVRGFVKNIKQHLIKGLIGWLTGALSEANITLPDKFDVKGIFNLVMQILGLTYANIKARVIKRYPKAEKVITAIEKGVEIIHLLITKGPVALWEMVKQSMANLKEMVMGAIRNFVITTVIKEAVTWLLGLLNPAGALVKILKLLFDLVMFFVERFQQIKDFVLSVYGAVTSIASGVLGKAAAAVENAMAKSLPVVIGLLASLAGLGGIGKTIQGIIKKVTTPINKVIDKVIDKVVSFAKKILKGGKKVAKKVKDKLFQWWKVKRKFKAKNGESHTLFLKGSGNTARLTMRSEEKPYTSFLNSLDEKSFNANQKTHLAAAKKTAEAIDKEKKAKVGGKTDAEKEVNAKAKQKRIDDLLVALGKDTAHLFGDTLPEWKKPDYKGKENADGFGSFMEITMLTKSGEGWKGGSGPSQAKHTNYDLLNLRRQSGGASFYIRGHLLNDNLGGPGKWFNMTPLSREGNHQHEAQVESFVKAGFNSGAAQRYKVVPQYTGQGGGQALKDGLAAKYPTQAATYNKIIDAEEKVPTTLAIEAATLEKKGTQYVDKTKKSWNLPNPIQRSVDKYFLSDSPKIIAVNLRSLGNAQALKDLNHAQITGQAEAIFKAVVARKADDSTGWFPSYAALAEETNKQGGATNAAQLTGWNQDGYILLK